MPIVSDLTTKRSGKLLVIRPTERRHNGYILWECLCDCGNTHYATASLLRDSKIKSCGCSRLRVDLTGLRFGRLIAVRRSEYKPRGSRSYWECVCDCGESCTVYSGKLKSGHTQSCGCYQTEKRFGPRKSFKTQFAIGHGARNSLIKMYKKHAGTRNLRWELTDEEFFALTQGDCFYCGISPHRIRAISKNGNIIYNGVDRRNNDLGYTAINAVSCCFTCNKAKGATSEVEFREWIRRVYAHLESNRGHVKTGVNSRPRNGEICGVELLLS